MISNHKASLSRKAINSLSERPAICHHPINQHYQPLTVKAVIQRARSESFRDARAGLRADAPLDLLAGQEVRMDTFRIVKVGVAAPIMGTGYPVSWIVHDLYFNEGLKRNCLQIK